MSKFDLFSQPAHSKQKKTFLLIYYVSFNNKNEKKTLYLIFWTQFFGSLSLVVEKQFPLLIGLESDSWQAGYEVTSAGEIDEGKFQYLRSQPDITFYNNHS